MGSHVHSTERSITNARLATAMSTLIRAPCVGTALGNRLALNAMVVVPGARMK